ncbi:MAG: glycosyltransferase family 2 protein [Crocinitomicaceae bacterium]
MNFYLDRYGFQEPKITAAPSKNLSIIVVIPCFYEPDLTASLEALYNCSIPEDISVEVITVINAGVHHSQAIKDHNRQTYEENLAWSKKHQKERLKFHFLMEEDLPKKHAGVGLARKIGMDEAVARFHQIDKDGIIVCFDADAVCSTNYITSIFEHFEKHAETPGCSIHYEHPTSGEEYENSIYEGIINYELHLRYYNQCMRYAGLPYAFHTVGSSMAVRSSAYQKQGGMNKRKAGEDFYFIHKIIGLGNFTELKSAMVIPSPRTSDRVPFGTGKAIGDWIQASEDIFYTYAFNSFEIIRKFVHLIPALQDKELSDCKLDIEEQNKRLLFDFLNSINFDKVLSEIRNNSTTSISFKKRFFQWFDAFKILKGVHFFRDQGIKNEPIYEQVNILLDRIDGPKNIQSPLDQLKYIRKLERGEV